MSDELVIVPSDGDGYVELARTKQGRLFRKHLLSKGKLTHPAVGEINIDDTFFKTLKKNFDSGVCPIVQVPLADADNKHTEAPDRNIGEVIGIEEKDDKLYAVLDIRDATHADKIGKTYLGASAMLGLDYTDTKTQQKVGPTLLHSCVTNRPYVTDLDDYEEIVAATSDTSQRAVLLTTATAEAPPDQAPPVQETDADQQVEVHAPGATEETDQMGDATTTTETTPAKPSLEEMLTSLKADHNIDVTALQAKAAEGAQAASLSQALVDALTASGVVKLTNTDAETPSTEDVVGAVAELADKNVTLSNRVQALEKADAEHIVDGFIGEGRIRPAERDARVELKLTNPAMFDKLLPAEPLVKLNNESGVTPPEDAAHTKNVDEEIVRLSALLAPVAKK